MIQRKVRNLDLETTVDPLSLSVLPSCRHFLGVKEVRFLLFIAMLFIVAVFAKQEFQLTPNNI